MNVAVEYLVWAAGGVAAIGVLFRQAVLPALRWARRAEKAWVYIEAELTHNSGSTTRDAIKRLEVSQQGLTDWTKETDKRFDHLDGRLTIVENTVKQPVQLVKPVAHVAPVTASADVPIDVPITVTVTEVQPDRKEGQS